MRNSQLPPKIPLFIHKIYTILEDPINSPYIDWTDSPNEFAIHDISGFVNQVMPRYFKHQNFCSIVRLFNMYGFQKLKNSYDQHIYYHPYFSQGNTLALSQIKRKNTKGTMDQDVQEQYYGKLMEEKGQSYSHQTLEHKFKNLINENFKILAENRQKLAQIQYQNKKQNKKMEKLLANLIIARADNQISLPSRWDDKMQIISNQGVDGTEIDSANIHQILFRELREQSETERDNAAAYLDTHRNKQTYSHKQASVHNINSSLVIPNNWQQSQNISEVVDLDNFLDHDS